MNEKFNNSINIIKKYELVEKLPGNVVKYLLKNIGKINEIDDQNVKGVINNFLIGNNQLALEAIRLNALELKFNPRIILTNSLDGEAKDAAKYFAYLTVILNNYNFYQENKSVFQEIIKENFGNQNLLDIFNKFLSSCLPASNKFCILTGGETTVRLSGGNKDSLGGRNQEMTLAFKKELIKFYKQIYELNNCISIGKFLFCSFGTDGIDGPTDAAGAIVTDFCLNDENDIDFINKCLTEHNSYRYFEKNNGLLKIGHTNTNVSDIQILLIDNFFK
jgi:glycerate 2-kinase